MSERPSVLEVAARAAKRPGIEPPTPRWSSTLAYLYGLPLTEQDVAELAAATNRSPEAIAQHAEQTIGKRRFRQLWARIGRRGRKSATAALVAVYEAVYGGHERYLIPGEVGLACVISKDIAGATVITRFVRLYAEALGLRVQTSRMGAVQLLEISGCALAIATLAATSEAPRGYPIAVLILDEWAHTPSGDEYVDTDASIIAAAEPAMAQFPDALVIGISTGLGRDGVHYERVERGLGNDDERNILAVTGASWEWSKDITPEKAAEIADGDPDIMLREFEGGVSENESLWMPQSDALAMFGPRQERYFWQRPFMIVDAAETADSFAFAVAAWGEPDPAVHYKKAVPPPNSGLGEGIFVGYEVDEYGSKIELPRAKRKLLNLYKVGGFEGPTVRAMGMDRVVDELARVAKQYGVTEVVGDDRAGPYLEALFSDRQVRFGFVHYKSLKHEAVVLCRSWARDKMIAVTATDPEVAEFKKQALRYRRYVSGGNFKYGKQGIKDDFVTLLVTLAVWNIRGALEQSREPGRADGAPTRKHLGGRYEAPGR